MARCHDCKNQIEVAREALSNVCRLCSTRRIAAADNYAVALKAEMKRVVRCYQSFGWEQRASNAANFRMGHQQRRAHGEFYYTHPAVPGRAFPKRKFAAVAALEA